MAATRPCIAFAAATTALYCSGEGTHVVGATGAGASGMGAGASGMGAGASGMGAGASGMGAAAAAEATIGVPRRLDTATGGVNRSVVKPPLPAAATGAINRPVGKPPPPVAAAVNAPAIPGTAVGGTAPVVFIAAGVPPPDAASRSAAVAAIAARAPSDTALAPTRVLPVPGFSSSRNLVITGFKTSSEIVPLMFNSIPRAARRLVKDVEALYVFNLFLNVGHDAYTPAASGNALTAANNSASGVLIFSITCYQIPPDSAIT
jgi:hypothetical protein